jgi:hypothetical protein
LSPLDEARRICSLLARHLFSFQCEADLQRAIAQALEASGYSFQREVALNEKDRIDFMVGLVGIEVKTAGSNSDILRQMHRYAQCESVTALVLVTSRMRHRGAVPDTLNGKPLVVHHLIMEAL